MKDKTISVRMNEQTVYQIEYLKHHLKAHSTTQILTEAIHALYSSTKHEESQKSPFELLEELNLIGCLEGEKLLSQNYKSHLAQSLGKKHQRYQRKKKDEP